METVHVCYLPCRDHGAFTVTTIQTLGATQQLKVRCPEPVKSIMNIASLFTRDCDSLRSPVCLPQTAHGCSTHLNSWHTLASC